MAENRCTREQAFEFLDQASQNPQPETA
ncbi:MULTISPECIES: hypothetical protein [Paenarthrobacter]|nr:hypothetical protein [Paenarthrobacter sp. PAE-2]MCW3768201.1 hypothetical protein [Paenarthrobacter sp. PAE-2]